MKYVEVYTDGACSGNPGPGGWAAILKYGEHVKQIQGGNPRTTNNRMELTAVRQGLAALKESCDVRVFTDSKYIVDAINKNWLEKWARTDFKKKKNEDLWVDLIALMEIHNVEFVWIKGHDGDYYNERCDRLAKAEAARFR